MWPFRRRIDQVELPWKLTHLSQGRHELSMSPGEWVVTDGGSTKTQQAIGIIDSTRVTVDVRYTSDELTETVFYFRMADRQKSWCADMCIDSGSIVICHFNSFFSWTVDAARRMALTAAASKVCPGPGVVGLIDERDECMAWLVFPPYGDGVYRMTLGLERDLVVLSVHLLVSK
jgi:hypothetical protein